VNGRQVVKVDGLEVELRRKRMKNIRLHVEASGLVWVSLPLRCPASQAVALVRSHREWVDARLAALAERQDAPLLWGEPLAVAPPGPALMRLYREEVTRATTALAAHLEPTMGRTASLWRFRWMRSRWGSCHSPTGKITINVALAALPPECLEEVVVHELAHLHVDGHGPDFYALMDRHLPNWQAVRRSMRAVPRRPA
jgi:predicted metal-dependent hydrolase